MYYTIKAQRAVDKAWEDYKNILKVLEVDTETITNDNLVVGIETPLDIIFIASRDNKKSIYSELSN